MELQFEQPLLLSTRMQSTLARHADSATYDYQPNIAVLIRTRNNASTLPFILDHVAQLKQNYQGRVDTLLVDTESTDMTVQHAKAFGATVIPLEQNTFTYPGSLNIGLAAVKDDVEATFLTVGHARPIASVAIAAAVQPFADLRVSGVYGTTAPNFNASLTEKLFFRPHFTSRREADDPYAMGLFGATNAMIRMDTWQCHPFDEAYAGGGEDTAWARSAIERDEAIVFEPLASVYHSHGVSPVNALRQWMHWQKVRRMATAFDSEKLFARRPDLDTN